MFRHIYIHVPYCIKKCPYCDFYSVDDDRRMDEFLDGLGAELARAAEEHGPFSDVETIFIGGGTPTYLHPMDVHRLGKLIGEYVTLAPGYEWTVEANPESATPEQIARFMGIGVNRVSVGVQSFDTGELMALGRAHSAHHARTAAATLSAAGLTSWSMDFLFGVRGQSLATWHHTVGEALAYSPPHVSAYALMIEPGSRYARDPHPERFSAGEELVAEEYGWLMEALADIGYEHYELSNYAKPGHRCRHNEAYWARRPYLGLGPSAHSFDGERRWWNARSIDTYLDALREGRKPITGEEKLTASQTLHETVMLHLRLKEGLLWGALPAEVSERVRAGAHPLRQSDLVELDEQGIRLTKNGWPVADAVIERITALADG